LLLGGFGWTKDLGGGRVLVILRISGPLVGDYTMLKDSMRSLFVKPTVLCDGL
jgi:hypothetical protein